MKFQYTVVTDDMRGDHAADVRIAVEPLPSETLHDFANRVLTEHKAVSGVHSAHLEIRAIAEPENDHD